MMLAKEFKRSTSSEETRAVFGGSSNFCEAGKCRWMKASTSFPSSCQKLDSKPATRDRWRKRTKTAKARGIIHTKSHNSSSIVNWNIVPIDWRMKAFKAIIQLVRNIVPIDWRMKAVKAIIQLVRNIIPIDWRMKAVKAIIQQVRWCVTEAIAPMHVPKVVSIVKRYDRE